MYVCNGCHEVFEVPGTQTERHYEVPYLRDEHFDVCPHCGSDDIEKAYKCSKCGEWIPEHQSKFNMCVACEADTIKRYKEFFATLTKDEQELISWGSYEI